VVWYYNLPAWVNLPVFVVVFVGVSLLLLVALRPWVRRVARPPEEWDRVLGYGITFYGLFYGITLGLIAVAAFQNFIRVETVVEAEAATLARFYQDVSGLPDPLSTQLQDLMRTYTQHVITVDWPAQSSGHLATGGTVEVDRMRDLLFSYRPASTLDSTVQGQAISSFNEFVTQRRTRVNEGMLTLPLLLWLLLWVGALISQVLLSLINVSNLRVHMIIAGLVSFFLALMFFVTIELDHPFYGVVSVTPDAYQMVLDDVMRR
jgi:hypothetical protein